MTVTGYRGQVVHHDNCTYCVFRHRIDLSTKSKKKEKEKCSLHKRPTISPHHETKSRYCEEYLQVNCECEKCKEAYVRLNVDAHLDERTKLW